jgi:hypothetical protein
MLIVGGCVALIWSALAWSNAERARAERQRSMPSIPIAEGRAIQ